ncbi:hypothetical protein F5H01DRAFT_336126 [Linnemannia elongata]|nr:hypothetical protein F5H01DRAFT_336126 [Linnemannia elongata]
MLVSQKDFERRLQEYLLAIQQSTDEFIEFLDGDSIAETPPQANALDFIIFSEASFSHRALVSKVWMEYVRNINDAEERSRLERDWTDSKDQRQRHFKDSEQQEKKEGYIVALEHQVEQEKTKVSKLHNSQILERIEERVTTSTMAASSSSIAGRMFTTPLGSRRASFTSSTTNTRQRTSAVTLTTTKRKTSDANQSGSSTPRKQRRQSIVSSISDTSMSSVATESGFVTPLAANPNKSEIGTLPHGGLGRILFPDLGSQLFRLHGRDAPAYGPRDLTHDDERDLYEHALSILTNWSSATVLAQKDCLTALSGIINTVDPNNRTLYRNFKLYSGMCVVEDLFLVTETQRTMFTIIIQLLGQGWDQDVINLRRHAGRRKYELEEQSEKGGWQENSKAMAEEYDSMKILEKVCDNIIKRSTIANRSETEDCCLWADVAMCLLEGQDVQVRLGELGAQTTRADRTLLEGLYSGTDSGVKSRKIGIFFCKQLGRDEDVLELTSWEAKSLPATPGTLMIQRRKNIRHNCCILNNIVARTGDASIWNQQEQPFNSPIILDIEGHRGLPYRILRLTNGLFVAGGCALEERMICLPRDGKAIRSFLERGHMSALLRVKVGPAPLFVFQRCLDHIKVLTLASSIYSWFRPRWKPSTAELQLQRMSRTRRWGLQR